MQIDLMVRELKAVSRVWRELAIGYSKHADTEKDHLWVGRYRGMASAFFSAANSLEAMLRDYHDGTYAPTTRVKEIETRLAAIVGPVALREGEPA